MDFNRLTANTTAFHPAEVVRKILFHKKQMKEEFTDPVVTLFSTNGTSFRGILVSMSEDVNQVVVIQRITDKGLLSEDLYYVLLSGITAVMVENATVAANILTSGTVPPEISGEVPSKLELKRRMIRFGEDAEREMNLKLLVEVDWPTIPATDEALFLIGKYLDLLFIVVQNSAFDEYGKKAWLSVEKIIIRHSLQVKTVLTREEGTIILLADLEKSIPPGAQADLANKIDNLL